MNRTCKAPITAHAVERQLAPAPEIDIAHTIRTARMVRWIRATQVGRRLTGTLGTTSRSRRAFVCCRSVTLRATAGALLAGLALLVSSVPAEAAGRTVSATTASWASSTPTSMSGPRSTSTSASWARSVGAAGRAHVLAANQTADLPTVLQNATRWVVGILATVATLFLTIGGARYLMAGGDPGEVERAKSALKSAGIGYALALLAPVLLQILRGILGVGG